MNVQQLRLCNFLVLPGEEVMALPTVENTSIVVVLTPNNTGITSGIRALNFLFYAYPSEPSFTEEAD